MENGCNSTQPVQCGNTCFNWGERTYLMGIINATPDSFSQDGLSGNIEDAVKQAKRFVSEGADIIDIGGESTKPGAEPVSVKEELERVMPIIESLSGTSTMLISIDTCKSEVAKRAVAAGAKIINDVTGLKADPKIAKIAAESGALLIIAANQRGEDAPEILSSTIKDLEKAIETARSLGVPDEHIIIDPGIGFGKTLEQNLELINCLEDLRELGKPILLGTSRKSMIGMVLDLPVNERVFGTASTVAIGIAKGADIIRVHDVKEMLQVCRMSDAIVRGKNDNF